eukprot:12391497-Prorocentrum_lima.AAC.1
MTVIAENALTTCGQRSPIQATLGYQLGLLPDLSRGDAHCADETPNGLARHAHRLREIALQGAISATAEQSDQRD